MMLEGHMRFWAVASAGSTSRGGEGRFSQGN